MNRGWVKLHRRLLDEPGVSGRPAYLSVWVHLLLRATSRSRTVLFDGREVELQPGQLITGRKAPCVEWRMKNLRIDLLLQGVDNKLAALKGLLEELGLTPEEAGFMGDDVIDLQVMDHCGFSAAPANAHPLAKQYARLVTERTGGFGAAREVCEFILEAQGKLDAALAPYLPQSHSAAEK